MWRGWHLLLPHTLVLRMTVSHTCGDHGFSSPCLQMFYRAPNGARPSPSTVLITMLDSFYSKFPCLSRFRSTFRSPNHAIQNGQNGGSWDISQNIEWYGLIYWWMRPLQYILWTGHTGVAVFCFVAFIWLVSSGFALYLPVGPLFRLASLTPGHLG